MRWGNEIENDNPLQRERWVGPVSVVRIYQKGETRVGRHGRNGRAVRLERGEVLDTGGKQKRDDR